MSKNSWKIVGILSSILLCVAVLSSCNTLEGAGKDIESAGESIQDAAD